jgi:ABC-type Fe3+ transport system permease subunit
MSSVLYPYVYLLARATFQEQSVCMLEASRMLGRGPWRTFFTVALPLARPAIVVGLALALMETLADFGTVDFFAVNTLTVGVFNVWLNMGNAGGAAQISLVALAVVVALLAFERIGRRGQRFHHTSTRIRPIAPFELRGLRAAGAFVVCALPIVAGFILPALVLARHAIVHFEQSWTPAYFGFARNSILLAACAAAGGQVGQYGRPAGARSLWRFHRVTVERHRVRYHLRLYRALSGRRLRRRRSQPHQDTPDHGYGGPHPGLRARRDPAASTPAAGAQ